MSLPNFDQECYIIITLKSRTVHHEERDYGESWGPMPAHNSIEEYLHTEMYTSKPKWLDDLKKIEASGSEYYAGICSPVEVRFSITPTKDI